MAPKRNYPSAKRRATFLSSSPQAIPTTGFFLIMATVISLCNAENSRSSYNNRINNGKNNNGIFSDSEIAEIESHMPLPMALKLIYPEVILEERPEMDPPEELETTIPAPAAMARTSLQEELRRRFYLKRYLRGKREQKHNPRKFRKKLPNTEFDRRKILQGMVRKNRRKRRFGSRLGLAEYWPYVVERPAQQNSKRHATSITTTTTTTTTTTRATTTATTTTAASDGIISKGQAELLSTENHVRKIQRLFDKIVEQRKRSGFRAPSVLLPTPLPTPFTTTTTTTAATTTTTTTATTTTTTTAATTAVPDYLDYYDFYSFDGSRPSIISSPPIPVETKGNSPIPIEAVQEQSEADIESEVVEVFPNHQTTLSEIGSSAEEAEPAPRNEELEIARYPAGDTGEDSSIDDQENHGGSQRPISDGLLDSIFLENQTVGITEIGSALQEEIKAAIREALCRVFLDKGITGLSICRQQEQSYFPPPPPPPPPYIPYYGGHLLRQQEQLEQHQDSNQGRFPRYLPAVQQPYGYMYPYTAYNNWSPRPQPGFHPYHHQASNYQQQHHHHSVPAVYQQQQGDVQHSPVREFANRVPKLGANREPVVVVEDGLGVSRHRGWRSPKL